MSSRIAIMVIIIMLVLIAVLIRDELKISYLEEKLGLIRVLTYESDTLFVYGAESLTEPRVFIEPGFVDRFTRYKSPFSAEFSADYSFEKLMEKYIRRSNEDHYGTKRRTGDKRRIHEGIDLFVEENSPVYPIGAYGEVLRVSDNPNHLEWVECWDGDGNKDSVQVEYGKLVEVLYPEGITSTYVHLNEVYVKRGDRVWGNTVLGITGKTGNLARSSKPSHLHLELRYLADNSSFDPRHRLRYRGTDFARYIRLLRLD